MAEMINKNIISTNEFVRKDGAMIDEITKVAQDIEHGSFAGVLSNEPSNPQ